MWKSHRIASAQDCCRKNRKQLFVGRHDGATVIDVDEEEQEEEKSRLVSCGVARSEDGLCYYGNPPSRAAMACKEVNSTLWTIFSFRLKKLPGSAHARSYCDALKKKCIVSLRGQQRRKICRGGDRIAFDRAGDTPSCSHFTWPQKIQFERATPGNLTFCRRKHVGKGVFRFCV
ncbi:hypothetical protein L7F22_026072 [Adiantum nelumboides]|nr:hypothetical protein [Adiantum nelumboides]